MPIRDLRRLPRSELENMDVMGLDGEFAFQCRRCAKCCATIIDLVCTPEDLFRIAVYLHHTPQELLGRYFETIVDAGLPAIKIATGKNSYKCPFLLKKKCIVHDAKPVACRVYPLARFFNDDGAPPGYILQDVACNTGEACNVKVRRWIAEFGYPEQVESGRVWTDLGTRLCRTFQQYIGTHSTDEVGRAAGVIFRHLYLDYDTTQAFLPQLLKNRDSLERVLREDYGLEVVSLEEAREWERMLDHPPGSAQKGAQGHG